MKASQTCRAGLQRLDLWIGERAKPLRCGNSDGGELGCVFLEDRHGADPQLASLHQRRAPHRAEHVCGGSISPVAPFVHVTVERPTPSRRASFSVPFARPRC